MEVASLHANSKPIWVKRSIRGSICYRKAYVIHECHDLGHHECHDLGHQNDVEMHVSSVVQNDKNFRSTTQNQNTSEKGDKDSNILTTEFNKKFPLQINHGTIKNSIVKVVFDDGTQDVVDGASILPSDKTFGHRDNASLTFLNPPNLLENVAHRYRESFDIPIKRGNIYTFTGWLLIAVNPYCPMPMLYNEEKLNFYPGKSISVVDPHPFAIAEAAYNAMLKQWSSQSIVISGESGAGKTECSKHVLKYLAFISDRRHDSKNQGVEYRVLQTNPILEAFGNAKTVRNDNSSRFGKLMKLHFDRQGRMLGASIKTYLLAKSRVCHVPTQERNYHVFYWLCRGAWPNERELWSLRPPNVYRYLDSKSSSEGVTQLQELRNAMGSIGLSRSTQQSIFRTLTAILTLGNVTFTIGSRCDGVKDVVILKKDKEIQIIYDLLGLDTPETQAEFELVTTSKKIRDTRSNLSTLQAKQTIDSLARSLYQLVFDYLVYRINLALSHWQTIKPTNDTHQQPSTSTPRSIRTSAPVKSNRTSSNKTARASNVIQTPSSARASNVVQTPSSATPFSPASYRHQQTQSPKITINSVTQDQPINHRYIGVLDIFGFEDLKQFSPNNFEQLCINYANERLHNFFLHQLIDCDRQLYINEGLNPPMIHITDNENVCLAISGTKAKPGIFELLDEVSMLPVVGSKDDFFCNKVNSKIPLSNSSVIVPKGPTQMKEFVIRHFAGDVNYSADGFSEKNVDTISNDLRKFLMESCDAFISQELCTTLTTDLVDSKKTTENSYEQNSQALCCAQCGERRSSINIIPKEQSSKPMIQEDRKHGCVPFFTRRFSTSHTDPGSVAHHKISSLWKNNSSTSSLYSSLSFQAEMCAHCGTVGPGVPASIVFDESDDSDENVEVADENMVPEKIGRKGREIVDFDGEGERVIVGSRVRTNSRRMKGKDKRRQLERKAKSLASLFSVQVEGLMASLNRTSSFFIRCIKPNDEQKSGVLDYVRVLQQLETGGMVGVLELMARGFPCRIPYNDLWERYSMVLPSAMRDQINSKDFTEVMLMFIKTKSDDFRIGHTRAFFRFGALQQLDKINSITDDEEKEKIATETFQFWLKMKERRSLMAVRCSVILWCVVRRRRLRLLAHSANEYYKTVYLTRKRNKAAIVIQKYWRASLARMTCGRRRLEKQAAIQIQRFWKGYKQRLIYRQMRHNLIKMQSWIRMIIAHRRYQQIYQSVLLLQVCVQIYKLRQSYERDRMKYRAATSIQSVWRGHVTRCRIAELHKRVEIKRPMIRSSLDSDRNRTCKESQADLIDGRTNRIKRRRSSVERDNKENNYYAEEEEINLESIGRNRSKRRSGVLLDEKQSIDQIGTPDGISNLIATPIFPSTQVNDVNCQLNEIEEGSILGVDLHPCNMNVEEIEEGQIIEDQHRYSVLNIDLTRTANGLINDTAWLYKTAKEHPTHFPVSKVQLDLSDGVDESIEYGPEHSSDEAMHDCHSIQLDQVMHLGIRSSLTPHPRGMTRMYRRYTNHSQNHRNIDREWMDGDMMDGSNERMSECAKSDGYPNRLRDAIHLVLEEDYDLRPSIRRQKRQSSIDHPKETPTPVTTMNDHEQINRQNEMENEEEHWREIDYTTRRVSGLYCYLDDDGGYVGGCANVEKHDEDADGSPIMEVKKKENELNCRGWNHENRDGVEYLCFSAKKDVHRKSPNYEGRSPIYVKGRPNYERGSPNYEEGSPNYERGSPSSERRAADGLRKNRRRRPTLYNSQTSEDPLAAATVMNTGGTRSSTVTRIPRPPREPRREIRSRIPKPRVNHSIGDCDSIDASTIRRLSISSFGSMRVLSKVSTIHSETSSVDNCRNSPSYLATHAVSPNPSIVASHESLPPQSFKYNSSTIRHQRQQHSNPRHSRSPSHHPS